MVINFSMLVSPIPRFGKLIIRVKLTLSSGFTIAVKYASTFLISWRSKNLKPLYITCGIL